MRQCSKILRYFVDDHFHSLYFVREQGLDLKSEKIQNVKKILSHLGVFVRHLKVFDTPILLEHEYPNLNSLKVDDSSSKSAVLYKFFKRKRKIKKLSCEWINDGLLHLIAQNAVELEELDTWLPRQASLMSLAQLRKLKRLKIRCYCSDRRLVTTLMEVLSANTELEILYMVFMLFEINNDEFFDALSNLTNLKELRFEDKKFTSNSIESIEMLGRMSKLESLRLVNCRNFPYQNFLESIRKSNKFRTIYIWFSHPIYRYCYIQQMSNFCMDIRAHRCLVSENPVYIYLEEEMFHYMKGLLTLDDLKSIEKDGNIRIRKVNESRDERVARDSSFAT